MDIAKIKKMLNSLAGDKKQAAIDAINAILSNRGNSSEGESNAGAGAGELDIDTDLLIPTSGAKSSGSNSDSDYDDPDDLLNKRKFHGTRKSDNSKENKSQKQQGPQIGDKGDQEGEIQQAEAAYRKANDYKKEAQKKAKEAADNGDSDKEQDYKDLADKAEKAAKDAKDLSDNADDSLDHEEQVRLKKIKDALNDIDIQTKIIDETKRAVFSDAQLQHDKATRKEYTAHDYGLFRFKESIDRFMRDELARKRELTWARPSRRYGPSSGIIAKGVRHRDVKDIPLLAVYIDQSGSWGPKDIEVANKAIANLNVYVNKNLLKLKIFYFGDFVSNNPDDHGQSTQATQQILDHIEAIHANNVVIMTDSDMDHQGQFTRPVTVNGGVWFLFRNGRSEKLMKYLRGRKLTEAFDI